MKDFTKIALVVALVLVILGSAFCAFSFCMGFNFREFRQSIEDGEYAFVPVGFIGDFFREDFGKLNWKDDGAEWNSAAEDEYTFAWRGEKDVVKIDRLYLDVYYGSVYIVENTESEDEIRVEVAYRKKNHRRKVEASVIDGTRLDIRETGGRQGWNNDSTRITVRIPKEMADGREPVLKEFVLKQNAGDIYVDTPLSAGKIDIKENAGECDVSENLRAEEEIMVEVNAGEMDLWNIKAPEVSLKAGVGQLDADKVDAKRIYIDCGVGSIDVSVPGKERDYDYSISCNMGAVSVGDEEYGGAGMSKEIDNGRDRRMQIDCGVGEVDVSFD